ncbi:MAG: hypothetical protein ACYTG3_20905 [Planctomycetota bacterium]
MVDGALVTQADKFPTDDAEALFNLEISHAFVNAVQAGFEGKLAGTGIEARLADRPPDPDEVQTLKAVLGELRQWNTQVWGGEALIAREGAADPSPDAPILLELMDELHADLVALVPDVEEALDRPAGSEAMALLAACLIRNAYTREHSVKGLLAWADAVGSEEAATHYRGLLPICVDQVETAHRFLSEFGQPGTPQAELRDEALALPGAFRSQIHGLCVLIGHRRGVTHYHNSGISESDIAQWQEANLDAEAAGHWFAFDFGPTEAQAWFEAGWTDPATAAAWKLRGFDVDEALDWHGRGRDAARAKRERDRQAAIAR